MALEFIWNLPILDQIFANWYRAWWNRRPSAAEKVVPVEKAKKSTAQIPDSGPLGKLLGESRKPHRKSVFSVYQEKYFALRVSAEYKRRWETELSDYAGYTSQELIDKKIQKPKAVRTMTNTSAEFWKNESPAFREQVQAEADAIHKEAMSIYELGLTMPRTALDYHK